MKVSLEYLYHFQCDHCYQWWSQADVEPKIGQSLYCPSCGQLNLIESIETFKTEARGSCLTKIPDSQHHP